LKKSKSHFIPKRPWTKAKITADKNKGQRPEIKNSLKAISNNFKTIMLTTKLNNPNVKNLKGKVIKSKIGFKNELIKPKEKAKIKKICHFSLKGKPKKLLSGKIITLTPGIKKSKT